MAYNRLNAVSYAHQWAFNRNPHYISFNGIGGDCTNFISQCLLAGGARMNYKPTFGWYYNSAYDRAPAWSGVKYLYNFLTSNKGIGPIGHETDISQIDIGDVIQLTFNGIYFEHSLLVVQKGEQPNKDNILVATHSIDSDNRPLSSYTVKGYRYLKIDVRG